MITFLLNGRALNPWL